MKKVAILVNTLKAGGAEKQSILLLNALKDAYYTTFIVFNGEYIDNKNLQYIKGENFEFIVLRGSLIGKLYKLYRDFECKNYRYLFTFLTKPNFFGSVIGKLCGIEFIYTSIRATFLPKWKTFFEKLVSAKICSRVIFNSYLGQSLFMKKGFNNTIVIPNGFVDIESPHIRNKKKVVKIISVGRFVYEKDYDTALSSIKAICHLKSEFIYQIVGFGSLENKIRETVSELGLINNVEIIINPNNIPELLKDADVYLSTSIFEGTSNSIMEAMNASLPIVATNVGDNKLLIRDGISGFLHEPGDCQSIAMSLEKMINNFHLRNEFGLNANKHLSENFSFEKFQKTYIRLIETEKT